MIASIWDQVSVLIQLGLPDPGMLSVAGVNSARNLLNPPLPSNALSLSFLKVFP
jgi:hypothetical protein